MNALLLLPLPQPTLDSSAGQYGCTHVHSRSPVSVAPHPLSICTTTVSNVNAVISDIDIIVLDRHEDLQHELDPGVQLLAPADLTLDVE